MLRHRQSTGELDYHGGTCSGNARYVYEVLCPQYRIGSELPVNAITPAASPRFLSGSAGICNVPHVLHFLFLNKHTQVGAAGPTGGYVESCSDTNIKRWTATAGPRYSQLE